MQENSFYIKKVDFNKDSIKEFNTIIDVRSPNEFQEDSIPKAINYPVLNDDERHKVGKIYSKNIFEARKIGAQIISKNISKILKCLKINKSEKILIYCWRGGLRSLSLYLVLKNIGFDVQILNKGYKSFRGHINAFFKKEINEYEFNILSGLTGSGKTFFLDNLSHKINIINLESLACHKGSILGNIPNILQPSQKKFESSIWYELYKKSSIKKIWVESESNKIGNVSLPKLLFEKMLKGNILKLNVPIDARAKFIIKDYNYFVKNNEYLDHALDVLKKFITFKEYKILIHNYKTKDFISFVRNLLIFHYDKAYNKRTHYCESNQKTELEIKEVSVEKGDIILNEMLSKF